MTDYEYQMWRSFTDWLVLDNLKIFDKGGPFTLLEYIDKIIIMIMEKKLWAYKSRSRGTLSINYTYLLVFHT
jgi:hypothetical protein